MTFVRGRNGGNFRHSVMMQSKGLLNNPGENNCFMNSAVQVLWHLDVFRRSFRLLQGHACLEECCIFCALKEIFEKYQASNEDALPPDVLRIALAKAFQDQRKFQIGRMDDAAECFENILRRLHFHIAYEEPEDMCNAKHCIPHQKFAMQILEQTSCKCGATSEPMNFFQIVNYVSASALIGKASQPLRDGHRPYKSFGELLKITLAVGEKRQCPDDKRCMYKERDVPPTKMHRTLLNSPDIAGIGIIWDTDRPSADYIIDLLNCLGKKLELKDIFDNISDDRAKKMKLRLVGIMTYYGKHYTTFFFNTRQKSWFYFDDAKVKEIGEDWELVKLKCKRGRFQPLLALYANAEGEPIHHSKASKTIKVVTEEELQQLHYQCIDSKKRNQAEKPTKRKSFKKMVGSAFRKGRKKQGKYSVNNVDMVLSVNGRHMKDTSGSESETTINNESFNDLSVDYHDDHDDCDCCPHQRNETKNKEFTQTSPMKGKDSNIESIRRTSSDERGTEVQSAQTDRLYKHKRHLSSIEVNTDQLSEASDYDNIDSPRSLKQSSAISSDHHDDEEVFSKSKSPSKKILYKHNKMPSIENYTKADNFDYAMNAAENILECSFTAEKEGNLIKAFQLCTDANRRYRTALDIPCLNNHMMQYADKKRWETHDRSLLLKSQIDYGRERLSKSADYISRGISKTSDYGSLSDTSCSPITPDFIDIAQNISCESAIAAKSIEEKKYCNLTDKSKNNVIQHKRIINQKDEHTCHETLDHSQPSSHEIEQLSALLKDFEVGHHSPANEDNKISHTISQTRLYTKKQPETSNAKFSSQRQNISLPTTKSSEISFIVTKFVSSKNIQLPSYSKEEIIHGNTSRDHLNSFASTSVGQKSNFYQDSVDIQQAVGVTKNGDHVKMNDGQRNVQIKQKKLNSNDTNDNTFLINSKSTRYDNESVSYLNHLRKVGSKLSPENETETKGNRLSPTNFPNENKLHQNDTSTMKTEQHNIGQSFNVDKTLLIQKPLKVSSSLRTIVKASNHQNHDPNQSNSTIKVQRKTTKWPLEANFSNSPRQMCEQCGTVTVEKPKRFCCKCQSDYL